MAQKTNGNYNNNLFSNHFLEERIQDLDEWEDTNVEEKFDELKKIYEEKKDFLSESLNEDQTQNHFIDPVFKALGHEWVPEARTRVGSSKKGTVLNPDYTFMDLETQMDAHEDEETSYFDVNYAVGDAKAWNRTLDKSTQDHTNPAFQIYNYVDRLRSDWGLLTNGKKWRLYSYEKCAADIYFEIDLEELLSGEKTEEDLEKFKYFYLFFRAESFEEGFLEKVYRQSVQYNEELEDDLEDKVYNALEVAVEGFFETNDIEKTEENIDLVHHSSLIFLYRILFILNAESRDLLPTEDKAYRQAFGLTELKRMIVEDNEEDPLFQETTVAWDNRLSRLFEGIDEGYDLHESEIPAYNGGLFDEDGGDENHFLAENKLYGSYIREILELLATRYDEDKEQRVIVDYKDLNIRHLGSVYEGLLEHQFEAADERKVLKNSEWTEFSETNKDWGEFDEEKRVEEGELYLTNESGERKATGSYYTPEYIVEYIVENTVGPKVEEKIEAAEENGDDILPKILELNVCDPAMGSGHFLTEATEFIAEHIVEHADLEKQDIDENEDELNWAKRQVVQNCIYGVDVNELAVELGKLSLWIETMAEGKPLNFLDHHLKHGNSLIGSDFDEIFSHPTEDQKRLDSERYQFGDPQEIKESFQEQYLEIEEMPENTVEQIHEKEQAYKQFIQENVLYQQFNQLANIHTRQYFEKEANSSDYESFLINIGNPGNPFENTEWYKNAQQDAENRNYFHWQLEFPKVFFGEQNGFDAVVGNPPWGAEFPDKDQEYLLSKFSEVSEDSSDSYKMFVKLGIGLSAQEDTLGFIIPNNFLTKPKYQDLRKFLLDRKISKIIDLGEGVFGSSVTYPSCITILDSNSKHIQTLDIKEGKKESICDEDLEYIRIDQENFLETPKNSFYLDFTDEVVNLIEKIENSSERAERVLSTSSKGVELGSSHFQIEEGHNLEEEIVKPFLRGRDIDRFSIKDSIEAIYLDRDSDISDYPKTKEFLMEYESDLKERTSVEKGKFPWYQLNGPRNKELFTSKKILVRETADEIIATADMEGRYYTKDTIEILVPENEDDILWILPQMNSKLVNWYAEKIISESGRVFAKVKLWHLRELPIKDSTEGKVYSSLKERTKEIMQHKNKLNAINLNIQDYLGNYSNGKNLGDLYTPVEGLSDKVVSDTSADRDSLRIGSVEFEERNGELILKVSARYKPDNSEKIGDSELDRWGYFETEKVPAMKFNVEDKMRPLIEEFVSLAVDEAGGFAGFRESATKTNSVIDRLEKLNLPKLEDVEQGLEKFIDNREEAEELEEEIQETDELIDAIVFDLYDLTEEEVETVLDSLDTKGDEKERILEKFSST